MKKKISKKRAINIESPSLFWVFLLISFLVILVVGCAQKVMSTEEYPLIFDAGSVEIFASLNKTDLIIAGELPKTPWE